MEICPPIQSRQRNVEAALMTPAQRMAAVSFQKSRSSLDSSKDHEVVRKLVSSEVFISYQQAFAAATGLTLSLQSPNSSSFPPTGFCALVAAQEGTWTDWLELQKELQENARCATATLRSRYGVSETAVPIRLGEQLIGYVQTGPVLFRRPTSSQTRAVVRELAKLGVSGDARDFIAEYKRTPVIDRCAYEGMVRLLEIFAKQMAEMANQIILQTTDSIPGNIARACEFIAEHYDEKLRLTELAAHVGLTPFALCKQFKRATKVTFRDYVARLRVEKAKRLLMNPQCRISEAAYQAGFQSLSNFNRHFRRIAGASPTRYRTHRNKLHTNVS